MALQSMHRHRLPAMLECKAVRPFCSVQQQPKRCRGAPCACNAAPAQQQQQQQQQLSLGRRQLLAAAAALVSVRVPSAAAYQPPPSGKRRNNDVLDGYAFLYPEDWSAVTTSGNDAFFRNPYNVEECLFVNITSPSSSKFDSVQSLGTPQQAAERLRQQYLSEFMSTRLGSQKKVDIVSASSREADGRLYYDIEMQAQSFASRSPLASTQAEVSATVEKEWDRVLLTTLGVAGKRVYEMRVQSPSTSFQQNADILKDITSSFRCREVEPK